MMKLFKSQITKLKSQMVRQAVRQAHGPEQSRKTHHPEPTCREPQGRTSRRGIQNVLKSLDSGLAVIPDPDPGRNDKELTFYEFINI
jgi:hypothetical protein